METQHRINVKGKIFRKKSVEKFNAANDDDDNDEDDGGNDDEVYFFTQQTTLYATPLPYPVSNRNLNKRALVSCC